MNIIVPSTGLRQKPDVNSFLETECLFGETVEIFDKYSDWVFCKLITDNYVGWINKFSLGYLEKPTHRVLSIRSFIYREKDIKSNIIHYVPMGSKLSVIETNKEWAKVNLSSNHSYKTGYVIKNDLISLNSVVCDWVSKAEQLLNTPYKWGGRDTFGIDCSALLQLSYQTHGEDIPRNTSQQIHIKKNIIDIKSLKRGCVIFWDGHVGVMTNNKDCIHANSYFMKTTVEPLNIIIKRIEKHFKILKILDFS